MKKIILIANPAAGSERRDKIDKVVKILGERSPLKIFLTGKKGDAEESARSLNVNDADIVVVAGGDGTINEVINGLLGNPAIRIPVGIIPLGISNVLAHELGIPAGIEESCDIIFNGITRKINLGIVNGRYFSLMVGVGFDAAVVHALNPRFKAIFGKLAYILTGFRILPWYIPEEITVKTDTAEIIGGYHVIISNSRLYGGNFMVTPEAGVNKTGLDICLFQGRKRIDILRYVIGIVTNRHLRFKDTVYRKVGAVTITSNGNIISQLDGDAFSGVPLKIISCKDAIEFIVPYNKNV